MTGRMTCTEVFRDAVAALGLPAAGEELDAFWQMVRDLHDQSDGLRCYLEQREGPSPAATVDRVEGS